jgi:hypothetical protein
MAMKNMRHGVAVTAVVFSLLVQGWFSAPLARAADGEFFNSGVAVQLDELNGFTDDQTAKVKQSAAVMANVLNSEAFHQAVLNFVYDGKKQFADNNGLTNEEIYASLMAGRETYSSVEDHVANLNLNIFTPPWYKKWSTVGYGYAGQPQIYMNSYYFNSYTLADVAANITHEWCHKLGFEHDYKRTGKRPYSVPYGVGAIMTKLAGGQGN